MPKLFFALLAAENNADNIGSHALYGINSNMIKHSSYDLPRMQSNTLRTLNGDMWTFLK